MSCYQALGLKKEAFSTSPDPSFFFRSHGHETALRRLEISIRLRRGLSVILGDVGTGKTTLMRALLQEFQAQEGFIFHMILDPAYDSEFQFLFHLTKLFDVVPSYRSSLDYKEAIEKHLFQQGVDQEKTVVLLIDEGQKLSASVLEILRMLLNYETNEYKLLQLVILAQMELLPKVRKIRNFMDRVALKYILNPLDEAETRQMIEFRLQAAGYPVPQGLFTEEGIHLIHQHSQGYPRRISLLCHDAMEQLIMQEKRMVDGQLIRQLLASEVR